MLANDKLTLVVGFYTLANDKLTLVFGFYTLANDKLTLVFDFYTLANAKLTLVLLFCRLPRCFPSLGTIGLVRDADVPAPTFPWRRCCLLAWQMYSNNSV